MSFKKMVLAVVVGRFIYGMLNAFTKAGVEAVAKNDKTYAKVDEWLRALIGCTDKWTGQVDENKTDYHAH